MITVSEPKVRPLSERLSRSRWSMRSAAPIYVSQAVSALMPLVIAPLIVRHLGLESFGVYAALLVAAQIAFIICEYSFDALGPRLLADGALADATQPRQVYFDIFLAKLLLSLIAVPMACAVASFSIKRPVSGLETLGMALITVGNAAQANWFHISMGRSVLVALLTIVGRLCTFAISLGLILFAGGGTPDLHFIALAVPWFIGGVTAMLVQRPDWSSLDKARSRAITTLRLGRAAFVGNLASAFQNVVATTMLGLFGGPASLGTYSAVDRLARTASAALKPIFQTLYPVMSKLHREQPAAARKKLGTIAKYLSLASVVLVATSFFWSGPVLSLIYGPALSTHGFLLTLLLLWVCAGTINNFLGIQGALASGDDITYSRTLWLALGVTLTIGLATHGLDHYPYWVAAATVAGELLAVGIFAANHRNHRRAKP